MSINLGWLESCSKIHTLQDLLDNLLSTLLKFREGHYGIMSDIQQMFHQILKTQDDQQTLRFL